MLNPRKNWNYLNWQNYLDELEYRGSADEASIHTHAHTHTHIYIYIYKREIERDRERGGERERKMEINPIVSKYKIGKRKYSENVFFWWN